VSRLTIAVAVMAGSILAAGCQATIADTTAIADVAADASEDVVTPDVPSTPDTVSDAGPDVPVAQGPTVITLAEGLELSRSTLLAQAALFSADLGASRSVFATDTVAWLRDGNQVLELGALPSAVIAAAWVEDQLLLATADHGVLVFHDGALVASPLQAAMGDPVIVALHADPDGASLWVHTTGSLWFYAAEQVTELSPEGLTVADTVSTWGAHYEGMPSLWFGAPDEVYTVVREGAGFAATLERTDLTPIMLSGDAVGDLWVLTADALHHRSPAAVWQELDLGTPVTSVHGHPASTATWFLLADGRVVLHQAGAWLVTGWDELATPVATASGGLMVAAASTTDALVPLGFVAINGIPDSPIRSPIEATVIVDDPTRVASIAAIVDGADSVTVPTSPPFIVTLDPNGLTEGDHTLEVTVTYNDGAEPKSVTATFAVGPALSWQADIEPIWAATCTPCHHPDTSSHPLHTAQLWRDEIDRIVYNVETGIMPLDPEPELSPAQIDLIKAWFAAGMPD